jgi:hypothetical protein
MRIKVGGEVFNVSDLIADTRDILAPSLHQNKRSASSPFPCGRQDWMWRRWMRARSVRSDGGRVAGRCLRRPSGCFQPGPERAVCPPAQSCPSSQMICSVASGRASIRSARNTGGSGKAARLSCVAGTHLNSSRFLPSVISWTIPPSVEKGNPLRAGPSGNTNRSRARRDLRSRRSSPPGTPAARR